MDAVKKAIQRIGGIQEHSMDSERLRQMICCGDPKRENLKKKIFYLFCYLFIFCLTRGLHYEAGFWLIHVSFRVNPGFSVLQRGFNYYWGFSPW